MSVPPLTLGEGPSAPPRFVRMSEEQAQALVHDTELAVVAGAGAGKTSTLAARYVLLHHTLIVRTGEAPSPQAVLVLTFTERAATEMRERCTAMVEAMAEATAGAAAGARPEDRPALLRRARAWRAVADRQPAAAIHTFHGFCARLLREFPAETHTPPGATPLDEPSARNRAHQAALGAVLELLDTGGDDTHLLLSTFGGASALTSEVERLLGRRAELRDAVAHYAVAPTPDGVLFAAGGLDRAELEARLDEWLRLARRVLALTAPAHTAWLTELRAVVEQVASPPSGDDLELSERWRAALSVLAGSNGMKAIAHHTAMGTKGCYGPTYGAVVAALKAIGEELSAWEAEVLERECVPTRHDRTLAAVQFHLAQRVIRAEERLAAGYAARAELDFTEMVARARTAVLERGLDRRLHERHRYVMVDEFQDTDVDQWAIVAAITRPDGPEDRLFVVGDPKQSIYGFRGGDVAVFERARGTMARGCVFADNHRSRPAVVEFVNRAFARILDRPAGESALWNVGYDPMRAASERGGGSVVLATAPPATTQLEGTVAEARWLARTIRDRILAGTGPWEGTDYADPDRHPKPPIAILLQRRKYLPVFEAALAEFGVPSLVADGTGFWRRPEVLDVVHTLRALVTAEPASVVGALRSPFFGVRDRTLALLARAEVLASFGEGEVPAALAEEPELPEVWARWATLRSQVRSRSVASALATILEEAHAPWLLALQTPDGRAEANVQQLLALADAADEAGTSPEAFARTALDYAVEGTRESEAALPATGVRVVLLTVHASKGLEYPVVIVPELGRRARGGGRSRLVVSRDDKGGWAFALPVPDRFARTMGRAHPGQLGRAKRRLAAMERAESRRTFYVACTRAKDHLVLVGHGEETEAGPKKAGPSWLEMLQGAELASAVLREELAPEPATGEATASEPRVEGENPPAVARPRVDEPVDEATIAAAIRPLPARPLAVFAPSELEAAFIAAGLAAPAPALGAARPSSGERLSRDVAAVRGTVVHGLLEDEALWNEPLAAERWRAEALGAGLELGEVEAAWPGLRQQLRNLRESPELLAVLDSRGAAELSVRLEVEGVRVEGRIDRLCLDRPGPEGQEEWMVVDYKTEDPGPDPQHTAARHRTQLLAYSVAASRVLEANGRGRVHRAAVFFTRSGELVRLADWSEASFAELLTHLRVLGAAHRPSPG